jgi:hypothetical protein
MRHASCFAAKGVRCGTYLHGMVHLNFQEIQFSPYYNMTNAKSGVFMRMIQEIPSDYKALRAYQKSLRSYINFLYNALRNFETWLNSVNSESLKNPWNLKKY